MSQLFQVIAYMAKTLLNYFPISILLSLDVQTFLCFSSKSIPRTTQPYKSHG